MTEQIYHGNEMKMNQIAANSLMILSLLMVATLSLQAFHLVDVGPGWTLNVLVVYGVLSIVVCLLIRIKKYDQPVVKDILFHLLVGFCGLLNFFYPLTSVFILFGPILISTLYYDRKFTRRVAVSSWVIYIVTVVANEILGQTSELIRALHVNQGADIWDYPVNVLLYYGLTRSVVMGITTMCSVNLVDNGRRLVLEQDAISRKAAGLETAIQAAAEIQQKTMAKPEYVSRGKELSLYAGILPAKAVGGDIYDHFRIGDHMLCVVVADVSDKGIPAAMFSVRVQSAIRFVMKNMEFRKESGLEAAATEINQLLCHNNCDDMFATAWIGCIDLRTGFVKYVNAGHMPPLLLHADGKLEKVESEPQLFMGMFRDTVYEADSFRLHPGDRLVLYTDGVTDCRNEAGETFGENRLTEKVKAFRTERGPEADTAEELYRYVSDATKCFAGSAERFDDETVLAAAYAGAPALKEEVQVDGESNSIEKAVDTVNGQLEKAACPEDVRRNIDVIIDELCTNTLDYGFEGKKDRKLRIVCEIKDDCAVLEFRDFGRPFNPLAYKEKDPEDCLSIGGNGILLVKSLSNALFYRRENGENVLTVTKFWKY